MIPTGVARVLSHISEWGEDNRRGELYQFKTNMPGPVGLRVPVQMLATTPMPAWSFLVWASARFCSCLPTPPLPRGGHGEVCVTQTWLKPGSCSPGGQESS